MVVHSHNGIPANTKRASHLSVINTWMSPTDMMCVEEGRHTREHAAGSHLQKAQTQAKFFSGVRSRVLAPLGRGRGPPAVASDYGFHMLAELLRGL